MSRPSAGEIKVATNDLRAEATVWTQGSETLTGLASKIEELKFNRVEAGLFQALVTTHSELVEDAAKRCTEGAPAFANTGTTLKFVADKYDEEDQVYADQLKNIW
ncbi:hypothetical protein [Nocardia sp. NPDC058666]|uniref:hypothetical protein n=1 Tax=unclassified Nocardia TaxID=2637762 RepID=UPI003666572C